MNKISAVFLSLLMLSSNIGLTMSTHFCAGHAVASQLSVGTTDLDCGTVTMDLVSILADDPETALTPQPCCQNEHQVLQLEDNATNQKGTVEQISIVLVAFVHAFIQPITSPQRAKVSYVNYTPPLLDRDIAVLFQSFLI